MENSTLMVTGNGIKDFNAPEMIKASQAFIVPGNEVQLIQKQALSFHSFSPTMCTDVNFFSKILEELTAICL